MSLCTFPKYYPLHRGFTLVEIMVIVVIIGMLAALAIPGFRQIHRSAVSKRYINDVRQIRGAVERYTLENGAYPPNGSASMAAVMRGYVPDSVMDATKTPLGGVWDWDYQQSGIIAMISVWQPTATDEQLLDIDKTIDDGDLSTGIFRKANNKASYIMEL